MQVLKEEMREKILGAAEQLFFEYGFTGTTTRMIANQVGISVSHLYLYYENKEALYGAIADPFIQYFTRNFERLLDHNTELDDMSQQLSHVVYTMIISDRKRFLLVLEKSKGTKYEDFKIKLINELRIHMQKGMNDKIHNKGLLAHVFAKGLMEGIVIIADEYIDVNQLKHNLECLMDYHTEGMKGYIKKEI